MSVRDNGGIIGKANTPTMSVASGVWSLAAALKAKAAGTWPVRAVVPSFIAAQTSATDLTTYTFAASSLGTAAADRRIIVGISSRANAARTLNSVTVGGVSASLVATANNAAGGADIASLWIADVPTGATGDIVVTFSGAMLRCGIGVWRLTGAASATASDSDTDTTIAGVPSVAIDVPAGGVAIGVAIGSSSGTATFTWAGIAEDYDTTVETSSMGVSGAHTLFAAAQTGLTVSATVASATSQNAMAVASWGP